MNKIKNIAIPLLGILLFGIVAYVLRQELVHVSYHQVVAAVSNIQNRDLFLALFLTVLSYIALAFNDRLALNYAGRADVPFRSVSLASFVAYVLSHNIGFSVLSGTPVRYRLYSSNNVSAIELAKVMGFNGITFWLGFCTLAGISFLFSPPSELAAHSLLVPLPFLGILFVGLVVAYLVFSLTRLKPLRFRSWEINFPSFSLAAGQVLSSSFDWLCVASALYILLPASLGISFLHFLSLFLAAQIAGLLSQVPGGIGVFEGVLLVLLPKDLGNHQIIGSLIVFRFVYYLLPLCLATVILGMHEIMVRKKILSNAWAAVDKGLLSFIPAVFAGTTFLSGLVLLISGATPTIKERLNIISAVLPLPIVEISHLAGSIIGVFLIFLSRGLLRRLDVAWSLTQILLLVGALVSILKGVDYEEAIFLSLQALVLLPCRKHFVRKSRLLADVQIWRIFFLIGIAVIISIFVGAVSYRHLEWSGEMWWTFAFNSDAPRFIRASLAIGVVLFTLLLATVFNFSKNIQTKTATPEEIKELVANDLSSGANLALTFDKQFFFNTQRTAFLMYRVQGRSWVVMGNPIGVSSDWQNLLWDFREEVGKYGGRVVFYQVPIASAELYLDLGMSLTKLGEEALVSVQNFTLEGNARKNLRQTSKKAEKEGLEFEVVAAAEVENILSELQEISNIWLASRNAREKSFSLGKFDKNYLRLCPCAVVRKSGKIIAFANLWLTNKKEEFSFDLMRHVDDIPYGLMDFLFVKLIFWGKEQGYLGFNLGMAPLSGIESRPDGPAWNKFAAFIFRYGSRFYDFRGLRLYKEKFHPSWRPLYLATPGWLSLPAALADITLLISGNIKGVITK